MKIGNYTADEILEFMTEGEGRGFLGRSMYDAIMGEIERLNKELETLKQPQVFIDTQDMEERYGEELYKEYLEKENKRLNNKLKNIKSQLDYLETYSSKEDVFEDMKGRLDRINKIIGSDKE